MKHQDQKETSFTVASDKTCLLASVKETFPPLTILALAKRPPQNMIPIQMRKQLLWLSTTLLLCFLVNFLLSGAGSTIISNSSAESLLDGNFHLRLLQNHTQARCMDGTPSGYWFRDGSGADRDNFLLVFVGAGWCRNAAECLERSTGGAGSSKSWYSTVAGYGITSADPSENPDFHSFSVAWVGYCDGAFFMGNQREPLDNGLYFQGQAIVEAVVSDLVQRNRLSSAQSVMVTGESSGGLAAALSVDRIRMLLPEVKDVRVIVDAGYFLDLEDSGGDRNSLEDIRILSNMTLNSDCLEHYAHQEEEDQQLWRCASMPYVHRFIQSPMLIVQSIFDYSQLGAYGMGLNCTPPGTINSPMKRCEDAHMQQFQAFGVKMVQELHAVLATDKQRSVFALGCITHALTQYGLEQVDDNDPSAAIVRSLMMHNGLADNSIVGHRIPLFHSQQVEVPAGSRRTVARAVCDWYFGRNNDSHLDFGPWPSNEGCAWMGMPY